MSIRAHIFFMVVYINIILTIVDVKSESLEETLETILSVYERDVGPPSAHSGHLPIDMALHPRHMSINENDGIAQLYATLLFTWIDERLSFNETENVTQNDFLIIDSKQIWKPSVVLINSLDPLDIASSKSDVAWNSGGVVIWDFNARLTIPCSLDFESTSSRDRECEFDFQFISTTENYEILVPDNDTFKEDSFGTWKVSKVIGELQNRTVTTNYTVPILAWRIEVQRMHLTKVLIGKTSAICLCILYFATLVLSPKQKIVILSTILLASTYLSCVFVMKSQNGISTPNSVMLFASLMIITTVTVLMNGILGKISRRKSTVPSFLTKITFALTCNQNMSNEIDVKWRDVTAVLETMLIAMCSFVLVVLSIVYL